MSIIDQNTMRPGPCSRRWRKCKQSDHLKKGSAIHESLSCNAPIRSHASTRCLKLFRASIYYISIQVCLTIAILLRLYDCIVQLCLIIEKRGLENDSYVQMPQLCRVGPARRRLWTCCKICTEAHSQCLKLAADALCAPQFRSRATGSFGP